MPAYKFASPQHERLCARIQALKEQLERITEQLDDMPSDAFPPADNEALGAAVTALHEANDRLTSFT